MVKLIVFFTRPKELELESFENMFSQRYVPLVTRIPDLKKEKVSRAIGAPRGEAPYYIIHELWFENYETLVASLNTVEGRAAGQELMNFAREQVTMMYAETWEE
jgi:uncharacterized protein (TIGR02118 family)